MTIKRTASGAALLIAGRMIARMLDFITLLVLARILSPADFGIVAIATTVVVIVEALLELPVGLVLVRLPRVDRADVDTAFTLATLRAITVAATLALLAWPVSAFYGDPRLFALICAIGLAPAARSLCSPRLALFARDLNFKPDFALEVIGKSTSLVVAIGWALLTTSYWALVAGTLAAPLAMIVASYVIAPCRPRLSLRNWRPFASFLGWTSASQLASAINWQCDRLLLARFVTPTQFGQFSMATDLSYMPTQALVVPAMRSVMPGFVTLSADAQAIRTAYQNAVFAICAIVMPATVGLALLSEPVIRIALSDKWLPAAPILVWMALATIPELLVAPLGALAMALNQTNVLLRRSLAELSIKLPLTAIAAAFYGISGVVLVRVAVSSIICLVSMVLVRKLIALPVRNQLVGPWRIYLSSGLMACVVLVVRPWVLDASREQLPLHLAAAVALGALAYGASLFGLWLAAGRPAGVEAAVVRGLQQQIHTLKPIYDKLFGPATAR
ncbi:lipopolysaccharide biosynthesis protein [Chelatococcus reniformis]|uniref:Lipopolysaccharide biosynthesis protein n=1 Tax=Chelatococcus reniformis TaxID=1494448 RepID=A0A916UGN9_9HYPH|nr:lipopolysaccharide biosynthesis protein [Chelatococcus reniformis]GGC72204.1 lipopolysaccharide biosynthesis protein [Chelatococcus reniformis]